MITAGPFSLRDGERSRLCAQKRRRRCDSLPFLFTSAEITGSSGLPARPPAGLPADRMAFINAAVNKSLAGADMKKFLDNESAEAWIATPQQIADLLPKEIDRYRKAAKEAGVTATQ